MHREIMVTNKENWCDFFRLWLNSVSQVGRIGCQAKIDPVAPDFRDYELFLEFSKGVLIRDLIRFLNLHFVVVDLH